MSDVLGTFEMLLFRQTEQPALVDILPLLDPGDYSRLKELDCSENAKNLREGRLWMYGKPNGASSKLHLNRAWTFLRRLHRHVLLRVNFVNHILHMVCPSHLEEALMANKHWKQSIPYQQFDVAPVLEGRKWIERSPARIHAVG